MAITTTVARGYALRLLLVGLFCLVFGVWGVYDFVWGIPQKSHRFQRAETARQVQGALAANVPVTETTPKATEARVQVLEELHAAGLVTDAEHAEWLDREGDTASLSLTQVQERLASLVETAESEQQRAWREDLLTMWTGIPLPGMRVTTPLRPEQLAADEVAERTLNAHGDVSKPAAYDRWVRGALFIPCLPFGPVFLWGLWRTAQRRYRLDDDGTLHMPEGRWTPEETADIDMSRWMAKSIAHVVHRDGTRVKLDDYKHRNLHLIVGAIAHRLHPDEWTPEAKPVGGPDEDEADDVLPEEPAADETPVEDEIDLADAPADDRGA